MRVLSILIALFVACGLVVAIWLSTAAEPSVAALPAGTAASTGSAQAERVARLEEQVRDLTEQLEGMAMELTALQGRERVPLVAGPGGVEPRGTPVSDSRDPRWYLDQYVQSFRGGGEGSEYFRLAVDAYLPSLLEPVLTLAANPGADAKLRLRLVEMLGDKRFRLEPRVVKALVDRVGEARRDTLVLAALQGLTVVADGRSAPALERVVWRLRAGSVRVACIRCILQLAGGDANRAIASLMKGAPDEESRVLLIALLDTADLAAALDVFRFASQDEKPVRLAAAGRLGEFREEPFALFTKEWIGREPDEHVRRVLGEALHKQHQIPSYHPMKMTGAPDVSNVASDNPNAWASQERDSGDEWVELTYANPFKAHTIRIFEVYSAGAVARVFAIDTAGNRHQVWAGDDPTRTPGVFDVTFQTTSFPVAGVRIELDTKRAAGWNEIDAVELVGRGTRAWAKSARASDYYGGGGSSRQVGSSVFFSR